MFNLFNNTNLFFSYPPKKNKIPINLLSYPFTVHSISTTLSSSMQQSKSLLLLYSFFPITKQKELSFQLFLFPFLKIIFILYVVLLLGVWHAIMDVKNKILKFHEINKYTAPLIWCLDVQIFTRHVIELKENFIFSISSLVLDSRVGRLFIYVFN